MATENSERVVDTAEDEIIIDVDKLLVLVEARPEIYDISRKDHHNQDAIAKAWQLIGQAMNVPAGDCKAKWYTLRSSYSRYLRDVKKTPSGSAAKKKKWHLADAMNFVLPFLSQSKKTVSNMGCKRQGEISVAQECQNEVNEEYHEEVGDTDSANCTIENDPETSTTSDRVEEINPRKKRAKTPAEVVAEPMAAYFKSLAQKKPKEENPMILFFKSLMPEVEKLSTTSQRRFKMDVMQRLNHYLDTEEGIPGPSMSTSRSASIASDRYFSDEGRVAPEEAEDFTTMLRIGGYHSM